MFYLCYLFVYFSLYWPLNLKTGEWTAGWYVTMSWGGVWCNCNIPWLDSSPHCPKFRQKEFDSALICRLVVAKQRNIGKRETLFRKRNKRATCWQKIRKSPFTHFFQEPWRTRSLQVSFKTVACVTRLSFARCRRQRVWRTERTTAAMKYYAIAALLFLFYFRHADVRSSEIKYNCCKNHSTYFISHLFISAGANCWNKINAKRAVFYFISC